MNRDVALGIIRHFITIIGGALAGRGYFSTDYVEPLAGALLALVGVVWSIVAKQPPAPPSAPPAGPSIAIRLLVLALLSGSALSLAACNTTDVQLSYNPATGAWGAGVRVEQPADGKAVVK